MGFFLSELFSKGQTAPYLGKILNTVSELFPTGQWVEVNLDNVFGDWKVKYDSAVATVRDPGMRAQADYWQNRLQGEFQNWQQNRDQEPADIKLDLDCLVADRVTNLFRNLKEQIQDPPKEYRDVSSTVLKMVAAGLWNKQIGWFGLTQEPLDDTIIKLRVAYDCDRAWQVAALPGSLFMDPQENPGTYWGSKFANLSLPPQEQAASTKIYDALKALHGDVTQQQPLNPKDRQAALKDLAENVTTMLASGNRDAKILLPVLAEATRETLGSPRGKRSGGSDKPSFAMTPADRDAIGRDVDLRRGW
jgi:hypothetical protein